MLHNTASTVTEVGIKKNQDDRKKYGQKEQKNFEFMIRLKS